MHKQSDEDLYDVNTAQPQWSKLKNSDLNSVQNDQRFKILINLAYLFMLNYFLAYKN